MWRWYTAEDRRQAAAIVLLLSAICASVVGSGPILAGQLMIMTSRGAGGPLAEPRSWPTIIGPLWAEPTQPAAAFGAYSFSAMAFWICAVLITIALLIACGWFSVMAYRTVAPTGTGFAGRTDVAGDLSVGACRRRAKVTRPDLDRHQRAKAATGQLGIPLHQAPVSRNMLWLPLENATGVIAPQQSGKTLMDLIHKVLAAPGGLIVTSTKLDLYLLTARARERGHSPVLVLDLTGAVNWPHRVRWNPIRGCTTVKAAKRRAQALLRATAGTGGDSTGNHAFFERRAVDVMTGYLLAAALSSATLAEFVSWCQNDLDIEAAAILREYPEYAAVRRACSRANRWSRRPARESGRPCAMPSHA